MLTVTASCRETTVLAVTKPSFGGSKVMQKVLTNKYLFENDCHPLKLVLQVIDQL